MFKYQRFLMLSSFLLLSTSPSIAQENADLAQVEACLSQRAEIAPARRWPWDKYEYDLMVEEGNLNYHTVLMGVEGQPQKTADAVVVTSDDDQNYCDVPIINVSGLTRQDYEAALGKNVVNKIRQASESKQ